MKKIRVMYVYVSFYRGAGGEMHPFVLAKHLNREKFDFGICVIENAQSKLRLEIEQSGCQIYDLNLARRLYNPINVFKIFFGFYYIFKKLKPHIVQTQALHTNVLGRLAAILAFVPIIISTENSLPDIEKRIINRIANIPLNFISNLLDYATDKIIVVSDDIRKLKNSFGKSHKIELIHPPMDPDLFSSISTRDPYRIPFTEPTSPVLGMVGRLSREKGHTYLIAAMPEILTIAPEARLIIVGSGPDEQKLKEQVKSLRVAKNVEFVGYTRQVIAELARMDVLFVPSLTEGLPIVVLEAMLVGLPVVGSRVGGIPEAISHGETGILVPPRDTAALVEALRYLVMHPQQAVEMGKQGKRTVLSDFHPSKFLEAHEKLYERLINLRLRD
jgi:glycosyltransferase involved in cell wall biosynthesis